MPEKVDNQKINANKWDKSRDRQDQERNNTLWRRGCGKGIEDSQESRHTFVKHGIWYLPRAVSSIFKPDLTIVYEFVPRDIIEFSTIG